MSGTIVRFSGGVPGRRVVLTFPLRGPAIDELTAVVGDTVELVDVRDADGSEDLVVTSPVSRQLIGKLARAFPRATVLVVEVEDRHHDVDLGGPVTRALDAGADGYAVARSLGELGRLLERGTGTERSLQDAEPLALGTSEPDELGQILDALIVDRESATEPGAG